MKKICLVYMLLLCFENHHQAQTITDFDNNIYNTITIGSQVWMKENLRSIHYSDGSAITGVWSYNASDSLATIYGRLYSWNSAMNGALSSNAVPSGVQGVCPAGWHLPSAAEWSVMIAYFGGDMQAGASLKEEGMTHWNSPNTGATNSSAFTALPGGSRNEPGGDFVLMGITGFWWTTVNENSYVTEVLMGSESSGAIQTGSYMAPGYNFEDISIRCVKNSIGAGIEKEIPKGMISINPYMPGNKISIIHESIPLLEVSVFSVEGKALHSSYLGVTDNIIDIGSIPSGIYLVKASGSGVAAFKKFVKF